MQPRRDFLDVKENLGRSRTGKEVISQMKSRTTQTTTRPEELAYKQLIVERRIDRAFARRTDYVLIKGWERPTWAGRLEAARDGLFNVVYLQARQVPAGIREAQG